MYKLEILWPDGSKTYRSAKTSKQAYRIVKTVLKMSSYCDIRLFKGDRLIVIFVN